MTDLVELKCSNCGAPLKRDSRWLSTCHYCGTEYVLRQGDWEIRKYEPAADGPGTYTVSCLTTCY